MANIKIRVGAALEANTLSVFIPLEKAAERARKNIERSFTAASKSPRLVERATKTSGDAIVAEVEREGDRLVHEEEKAQQGRVKEVEKAARERVRLERQAMREIERELAAVNREADRAQRSQSRGGAIGIGRRAAISTSRGAALGYGLAGRAISMGVGAVEDVLQGIGVETSMAPHMARAVDLEQRSNAVVSAGYIPGSHGMAGMKQDPEQIKKEIQDASNYAAIGANEIAEGLQKFVGLTGDLALGRETLRETAKLAKATNSDFLEMSAASGEVANHMGNIPHKAEAVGAVMRVIAGQGKMGALEIKDFAMQMAKIAANAPRFAGNIGKTIGELGLIAQESKMGGGSASAGQAATSVMSFVSAFSTKATFKNWSKVGLNPFTDDKHTLLRSPEELIKDALKSTHGDQTKLQQLFPNARAMKAVNPFASIYSEANGDETEKLKAVSDEFGRLRHAQLDAEEVSRAFGAAMDTSQSKVQLANNRLDQLAASLTTALLPAIAGLAPAIEALTPSIESAIGWFAKIAGIDPKREEAERKRREQVGLLQAAQKELAAAEGQGEKLTRGPNGAVIQVGTYDKGHETAMKAQGDKQAADIAAKEAEHARHVAEFKRTGTVPDFGTAIIPGLLSYNNKDAEKKKFQQEELDINRSKIDLNSTNAILSDIRTAIEMGRMMYAPDPDAPKPGVTPADSP